MNQYNVIRKDGDIISTKLDLSKMKVNGDYHVIHSYDPKYVANRVMKEKLQQLDMWVNQTFNCAGEPPVADDNINKAFKLCNSDNKQDFIDIVNWLMDTKDN